MTKEAIRRGEMEPDQEHARQGAKRRATPTEIPTKEVHKRRNFGISTASKTKVGDLPEMEVFGTGRTLKPAKQK